MAGHSRNVQFGTFGTWTQEEYDRLFGGKMSDIDVIAGYVESQPIAAPIETVGPSYEDDDFTNSQLVQGEEYVPNTQYPPAAMEFPPELGGVPGSSSSYPKISDASTTPVETKTTGQAAITQDSRRTIRFGPKEEEANFHCVAGFHHILHLF